LGLFLGFHVDVALVGHLGWRRSWLRRLLVVILHAILEALDGFAQVGTDIAQFLGAEYQHDDYQDDQPVPNAHRTHYKTPKLIISLDSIREAATVMCLSKP